MILLAPARAVAEWQIKPFVGFTFGGGTTFVDFDQAIGTKNVVWGVSGGWLGEILGVEGGLERAPGFFEASSGTLIRESSVRTLTGNVIVAFPRRLTEFTLRPYFAAGMGAMHVGFRDVGTQFVSLFVANETLTAIDLGGGATGFLSKHVGVSWDVRHFRGIGGKPKDPITLPIGANERLSFWRANMALAVKF